MVEVLAPRAGGAGFIASLLRLGLQIIDVVTGAGAITKYTIGPAWTGAEFATIQAAVDQAVLDGHSGPVFGQTVEFVLYPGVYPGAVVIPDTLPRWNLVGTNNTVGSTVTGAFTIQLPTANAGFGIDQVRFSGGFTVTQAGVPSGTISVRLFNVAFLSATTVTSTNLVAEAYDCVWGSGVVHTWTHRNLTAAGGRFLGTGVFDSGTLGATQFSGGMYIFTTLQPILTFRGRAVGLDGCLLYYSGAPAIIDECTDFSEYTNNTLSRNAGPIDAFVRKTGTSSLTTGGNSFVDGATYPFFEVVAGNYPNRGIPDNELRNVLLVAGSPVLTPAQVGSQTKTTVGKTDGGGVVTLPALATVEPGCTLLVKDINGLAGGTPFDVAGDGADTIDGAATISLTVAFECIELQAVSATNWARIGRYP